MDEQTRLLTLAHLKNGKTPAEAGELGNISYAAALKLKKELIAAEKTDKVLQLFKLNDAALEILLEGVTKQLTPAIDAFGISELIEKEVHELASGINGAKVLSIELQTAASALTNKIMIFGCAANNADTLLSLAKALCELQLAFKISEISPLASTSFEKYLKK